MQLEVTAVFASVPPLNPRGGRGTGGNGQNPPVPPSFTLVEAFKIISYEWSKNCILISQYVDLKIDQRYHHAGV